MGRQIVAELFDCDPRAINSLPKVRRAMERAARASNSTVVQSAFHKFGRMGVSGVLVIAESHISIHTWPEYKYAAVDVFTCGDFTRPEEAVNVLAQCFATKRVLKKTLMRGSKDELEIVESVLPDARV